MHCLISRARKIKTPMDRRLSVGKERGVEPYVPIVPLRAERDRHR